MPDTRLRRITYRWEGEGPPPDSGDALISTAGSVYVVVEARRIKPRVPLPYPKLALACLKVPASEVPEDAMIFDLVWDSRRRAA